MHFYTYHVTMADSSAGTTIAIDVSACTSAEARKYAFKQFGCLGYDLIEDVVRIS